MTVFCRIYLQIEEKYYKTLNLVVDKGVKTDIKDNKGFTAVDYLFWSKPSTQRSAMLIKIGREDIVKNRA